MPNSALPTFTFKSPISTAKQVCGPAWNAIAFSPNLAKSEGGQANSEKRET